jgi:hypothetical protein
MTTMTRQMIIRTVIILLVNLKTSHLLNTRFNLLGVPSSVANSSHLYPVTVSAMFLILQHTLIPKNVDYQVYVTKTKSTSDTPLV